MSFRVKKASFIIKSLLIMFIVMVFYVGNLLFFPKSIPNNEYRLIIQKNQSVRSIAYTLEKAQIIQSAKMFRLLARIKYKDTKIAAGLYVINKPISLWNLLQRVSNGRPDQIPITFVDGMRFDQIKNYIDGLEDIQHLTKNMTEEQIRAMLKINYPSLEGLLYPSTYFIAPNQTDLEIYQVAYKLMNTKLLNIWNSRAKNTVYETPYDLLIMASLITKETNNVKDMYLISAVFNNRLRIGMKLQDDPAVFYGLRDQMKITRKDFKIDTPYNTYINDGLPPTPITTPSLNALLAASNPSNDTKILYFIAVGGGKTKFFKTYKEHSQAVEQYLK